jgi:hypothetical protein
MERATAAREKVTVAAVIHGSGDRGQEGASALGAAGIGPCDGGVNAGVESAVDPQEQDSDSDSQRQHEQGHEPEAGSQVIDPKIQSCPH